MSIERAIDGALSEVKQSVKNVWKAPPYAKSEGVIGNTMLAATHMPLQAALETGRLTAGGIGFLGKNIAVKVLKLVGGYGKVIGKGILSSIPVPGVSMNVLQAGRSLSPKNIENKLESWAMTSANERAAKASQAIASLPSSAVEPKDVA